VVSAKDAVWGVDDWCTELSPEARVFVDRAYGFEVGCKVTATLLRAASTRGTSAAGWPGGTGPVAPAPSLSAPRQVDEVRWLTIGATGIGAALTDGERRHAADPVAGRQRPVRVDRASLNVRFSRTSRASSTDRPTFRTISVAPPGQPVPDATGNLLDRLVVRSAPWGT
jgi:hypothetical protein